MLPLSATLATNSIFEAFQDDSKLKALLHGHSYTAHAIGCSAGVTALDMYTDPACNPNLPESHQQTEPPSLMDLWDKQLVDELSRHARVQKLVVLGMLSCSTHCLGTRACLHSYKHSAAQPSTGCSLQLRLFCGPDVLLLCTAQTVRDRRTSSCSVQPGS